MNSDESDWDSMSEAPPVLSPQQGVELRYPAPTSQQTAPVVYPPQKQQSKGPAPPHPAPRPKSQATPNPKPPPGKPPPEAKAHSQAKKGRPKEVEKEPIKQKNIILTEKTNCASLDNSFSDLNQERYEDSGLGSSPEKANNALRGLENPSYEDEEEGGRGVSSRQKYKLPVPDERIALLPFEDMRTHYLQVCPNQQPVKTINDKYFRLSTTTKVSWSIASYQPWSIVVHELQPSCLVLSNSPSYSSSFSSDR